MKKFLIFLITAYAAALLFEVNSNFFFDGTLFQKSNWAIFFLLWYGGLYTITFLLFHKQPLWVPIIAWVIIGPFVEAFVFNRLNIFIDPIIYGIMGFVPFWIYHRYLKDHKF